jgi:hypothetical protein
VGNAGATITSSGAGITVSTTATAMLGQQLTFSGSAPVAEAGETVEIERLGHQTGWAWAPTASATVAPDGTFTATWATDHIGQFSVQAVVASASAQAAAGSPPLSIVVYLPAVATWYGPGLFGRPLACGGRLRRTTLGVANRRLRCGTEVALMYNGRTLTVPVIDRGPFSKGASWDLTQATVRALGVTGTAQIGAASLPAPPSS